MRSTAANFRDLFFGGLVPTNTRAKQLAEDLHGTSATEDANLQPIGLQALPESEQARQSLCSDLSGRCRAKQTAALPARCEYDCIRSTWG